MMKVTGNTGIFSVDVRICTTMVNPLACSTGHPTCIYQEIIIFHSRDLAAGGRLESNLSEMGIPLFVSVPHQGR